tara:strand:- start:416 stop:757 length:342 start_codon:yes stop_codon:yes gene_type:complete
MDQLQKIIDREVRELLAEQDFGSVRAAGGDVGKLGSALSTDLAAAFQSVTSRLAQIEQAISSIPAATRSDIESAIDDTAKRVDSPEKAEAFEGSIRTGQVGRQLHTYNQGTVT